MTSHHQGLDQAYYDRDGFRITAITIQAHDRSYSTSSIIGVDIHKEKPDRQVPRTWIICGVLLLPFLGIGIIPLIVGIWLWFRQRPVYWLMVETKTHRDRLHQAKELQSLKPLQSALMKAIAIAIAIVKLLKAAREKSGELSATDAVNATGLDFSDLQSLLQNLVNSGIATMSRDGKTGTAIYSFERVLSGMVKILKAAREKMNVLSVDDAVRAAGLDINDVQLSLDCLVISGSATISRDLRAERLVYKFN